MAEDLGPAAVGGDDGGQHADRRGLPGAVGAQEPEDGGRRHGEIDSTQGHDLAEALGQTLHEDRCVTHAGHAGTDAWIMSSVGLVRSSDRWKNRRDPRIMVVCRSHPTARSESWPPTCGG